MSSPAPRGETVRLEDYRPTDFMVHGVEMTVELFEGRAEIETTLSLSRRNGVPADAPLLLDGDELELTSLALDGETLSRSYYEADPSSLRVEGLPASGAFTLRIGTRIVPETNTKLMGLYRSRGVWCTQCEAEGFRRITYFLDRPDVLAPYTVRVEADRAAAPVLLSNGNPVEGGPLEDGRHYALWHDPHPKPSYLFALVAGDLDVLTDSFTTASGRPVDLAIYTEKGLASRAAYAMDAIKRSMRWDEERFGREYDLDVFNVVAISDFNMGAMENKGLNVFNHKYVLLDSDTATDTDYAGVETVIAHEYFHNWTGNRITCRDWFQLCLKEGLTVYRDQRFTADECSATVERIGSVRGLKAHQFPEDQGPLQHPVRPREYKEINNFYTATVYNKGAELCRMIHTILGADGFKKGMDLYFERHDGEAATIEDFVRSFEDATGEDLQQFSLWYNQAGTPTLAVEERFDEDAGRLTLTLAQSLQPGAAGTGTEPFHIPVRFGLVGPNGADMEAAAVTGAEVRGDVIHLRKARESVVFEGLGVRPAVSILRDFSAPVTLEMRQSEDDALALSRLDPNLFNRWRLLTDLVGRALTAGVAAARREVEVAFDPKLVEAILASVADETLEPAFRAQILQLPSESEIGRMVGSDVDPAAVHAARESARRRIGSEGAELFAKLSEAGRRSGAFSPDADSAGRRALANTALDLLTAATGDIAAAERRSREADNMTDRLAGLSILVNQFAGSAEAQTALGAFFHRFKDDDLVLDKWFALQAGVPDEGTVERVAELARHPRFNLANPNRARSLFGSFASANPLAFNRADGAGQRLVAEVLLDLDRLNPQVSARIATTFRSWKTLEPRRRETAREALTWLAGRPGLSTDLADIVERTLR